MRRPRPSSSRRTRGTPARTNRFLRLTRRPGTRSAGWLRLGQRALRVAIGRGGISANKREGDGATPRGRFRLIRLWWRADRAPRPRTLLPASAIRRDDAWCEDPSDRRYNQLIRIAAGTPGDRLWRADPLYDLIVELDHNTRPRVANRGSAVFIHVARPGFTPTAGCVALTAAELRILIGRIGRRATLIID
jgi:L,D-peptidoglycan transpeptidase YkuD (ErfK/YbiS/YcfS/YnhG family)